jgi:hypothetical protein
MSPFYAPGNARTRTMQPLSVRFDADLVSPVSSIPSTPTRQSSRSSSQRFYALQSGQPSILNAPPVPQSPARSQPPPTPPANRPTIPAIPPLPPLHRLLTASGNITPTSSNSPDRHFTNLPPPSPPPNVPLPPFPPRKKSHRPAPLREELRQSYLAMPSRMSAAEAVAAGVLLHPAVRENGASTGRVSVGRPVISEDVRRSMYPASMAAAVISPGGGSSGGGTSSVSPLRNEPQDEKRRDAGRWRRWIRAGHLQRHLLAALGEYIGTTAFLVLGIAVTQLIDGIVLPNMDDSTLSLANIVKGAIVAVIFGLSMALATTMFWRISGALFNPAVSLLLFFSNIFRCVCVCVCGQWQQNSNHNQKPKTDHIIFPVNTLRTTSSHPLSSRCPNHCINHRRGFGIRPTSKLLLGIVLLLIISHSSCNINTSCICARSFCCGATSSRRTHSRA